MKKSEITINPATKEATIKINIEEEILEAIEEAGKAIITAFNMPTVSDVSAGVELGPEPFTITLTVAPAEQDN